MKTGLYVRDYRSCVLLMIVCLIAACNSGGSSAPASSTSTTAIVATDTPPGSTFVAGTRAPHGGPLDSTGGRRPAVPPPPPSGSGSGGSSSGTVDLAWTPPTENTDGSALVNLNGYKIYYGPASQSYTQTITVANPGLTRYVIDNLPAGTYYFSVIATTSSGAQSANSPEASTTIT